MTRMTLHTQPFLFPEITDSPHKEIDSPRTDTSSPRSGWPFYKLTPLCDELVPLSYDCLIADCPWDFRNYSDAGTKKGADPHYVPMSLEAIKALPVSYLARGDCLLLHWVPGCMLPWGLEVMAAWGFTFKSEIIWRKTFPSGKPRMGTGYRVRTLHESVLVGTIGNPKHQAFPSLFNGIAREHSRKPEAFYKLIDKHAPGLVARADIFTRTKRKGWACWGDEVGKFNTAEGAEE